jgi:BNR/Asp-box repeat protein
MNKLLLATEKGLVTCEQDGDNWHESARGLTEHQVTSVVAREGVILAGTTKGMYRSDNKGQTWHETNQGLTIRHIRWLAYHPDISDLELASMVFAGTEPAGIFISHNGGESWRGCPEVERLRNRYQWFLPYSPESGCVRGFAFHGSRIYAAIEVGGVLVSEDQGETWQLAKGSDGNPDFAGPPEPFVYPDVHSIAVHPSSPDLVYAPTGGGFYRSFDGGKTWKLFYDCYCRAVWVDPLDSDHLILSPADGVDRNGRIEATQDGGKSWSMASNGLKVPWRRGLVERFVPTHDQLIAVLSTGQLLEAPLSTLEWQYILPEISDVNAATIMTE